jgi:hypothetical protein
MAEEESTLEHAIMCRSFIEGTNVLRKKLLRTKVEYQEAASDPDMSPARLRRLEHVISGLEAGISRRWPR